MSSPQGPLGRWTLPVLLSMVLLCLASPVSARLPFNADIPNTANVRRNGVLVPDVGHRSPLNGGSLTSFGTAFKDAGYVWSLTLCQADSDGDGFTNGEELGDPDCDWTPGSPEHLDRLSDISHPGDSASVPAGNVTPAPPLSTPVPTTPAPTMAPPGHLNSTGTGAVKAQAAKPFRMVGGATASFRVFARDVAAGQRDVGDVLEVTMTTPHRGRYVSIGTSEQQMTGLLLFCFVAADTTGLGECEVWRGDQLQIHRLPSPPQVHVQSVSSLGTGYEITARMALADFGVKNGKQRVITSIGPYDVGTRIPGEHAAGEYSNLEINFRTGEVKLPRTTVFMWAAVGVDVAISVCYCIVATVVHRCTRWMARPLAWTVMNIATMGVLVVLCAVVGVGRTLDAEADLQSVPWARGAGAAAIAAAVITLFPTPKLLNPGWLFGATYERLIPFHRVAAVVLVLASTVHFLWFAVDVLPSAWDIFAASGYDNSPLTGFVAWLCFTVVTASSLVRFPRHVAFWLWRLLHCLFVPGYVCAVLHYPTLILGLAVPLALYLCDVVARVVAAALAGARVKSVRIFEEAQVVELKVKLTGPLAPTALSPGDFVHLGLATTSNWALHPLTIAWYDVDKQVATFYVKAVGSPSAWSGKLFNEARERPEELRGTRVLWVGPYGALQIPLGRCPNTVLVSGGIGVTPMLAALQYLGSDAHRQSWGKAGAVCCGPAVGAGDVVERCVFVWAARGSDIIDALRPKIEAAAKASGTEVLIFNTVGGTAEATSQPSSPTSVGVTEGAQRREYHVVAVDSALDSGAQQTAVEGNAVGARATADDPSDTRVRRKRNSSVSFHTSSGTTAAVGRPNLPALLDERFNSTDHVAVYVCGPLPMTESCYDVASDRPLTYLHRETFEI